ncbi:hypothetical protein BGX27_008919 [Mortierella sp. AM989]|nr:hypothetical protein BGX27_008919 [Mortierella sp. AM989]
MKSLYHQLALIFGLASSAILILTLFSFRHTAPDGLLQKYISEQNLSLSHSLSLSNSTAPKTLWDPTRRYLVYLPFEGISNQFYSFQNAATLAKRLNRTLVVPPITSNRHDRLGTNQPWSHYMDLEHMSIHSGIQIVEWHNIKQIDSAWRQIIETGSRTNIPKIWKENAEPFPCQIIRGYGHDYFVGEEDSIGADFAYQFMLDLKPMPVPGFTLNDTVAYIGDILDRNQNSTEQVICLSFTFAAQFELGRNRWDIGWNEAGQYLRFLPRFASFIEDVIAFHFGLLERHTHPRPPLSLGTSILDKGPNSETFLSRKLPHKDYIAIHLRRGDIEIKCVNQTIKDCIIPLSEYKTHVDSILNSLPEGEEPPNVVLVSDTQSAEEKQEIDSYGWYRLDHAVDPDLLDASKVLGPFSPALIDSAVLTARGARWVIGSRRSTMSWLAAMRLSSWYNITIIYPKRSVQQMAEDLASGSEGELLRKKKKPKRISTRATRHSQSESENDDNIFILDRHEWQYFDHL